MTSSTKPATMQSAVDLLVSFRPFIDTYRDRYLLVSSQSITGGDIRDAVNLLPPVANDFASFLAEWARAAKSGPDSLVGKLDMELVEKGKFDMNQFRTVIRRMGRLDELIPIFLRVKQYVDDLHSKYQYNRPGNYDESFRLMYLNVNDVVDHLKEERENLGRLVERCNLYYQTRISRSMYWLQVIAVGVALIAVLIALFH